MTILSDSLLKIISRILIEMLNLIRKSVARWNGQNSLVCRGKRTMQLGCEAHPLLFLAAFQYCCMFCLGAAANNFKG